MAWYDHPHWGEYAAITENEFGSGTVTYFGALPSPAILETLLMRMFERAELTAAPGGLRFPLIVRSGINRFGNVVHMFFNYTDEPADADYQYGTGMELLSGAEITAGGTLALEPWGVKIVEER